MTAQVIDLTDLAAEDGFIIGGDAMSDLAGESVSNVGDINGDGIDDLIVGALFNDDGGNNAGKAYVIFGKAGGTRGSIDLGSLAPEDGFAIIGDTDGDRAGASVSNAGDINGDGIDDLIVGAPTAGSTNSLFGEAYVIFGKAGSTRANIDLSAIVAGLGASDGFVIRGDRDRDFAGGSVSGAGDINGDGIDDLIIGASGGDNGGYNAGEAYVIFGQTGATRSNMMLTSLAASDGFIISSTGLQDYAGRSVSGAGDVNGDGIDDLIVGARGGGGNGGSNVGETYVVFGKVGATRTTINLASFTASDGFIIVGDADYDNSGRSVSSAGDVNGDGIDDLIVGAYRGDDGGMNAGEAYVIFGKPGETRDTIDLGNLAFDDGLIIQGENPSDYAGFSVSGAGDVNGDGLDDLIVGASYSDAGSPNAGGAYVIYGNSSFGPRPAIRGTPASETVTGTSGSDTIYGLGGNDTLLGGGGEDRFNGGTGNDIYVIDSVGDTVIERAGEGTDRIKTALASYTLPAEIEILEYTGSVTFSGTGNGSANSILGGAMGDTLSGLGGDDTIAGGGGNDLLDGGDGIDTLSGQTGNDTLNGGDGNDRLIGGAGVDLMNGGAGNDQLQVDDSGDVANGGDGVDTVQIVAADLVYVIAGDVEIVSNQSGGAVTVTLNALANTFGGSAAKDIVEAGDGNDSLYGRAGNDRLLGQGGSDYIDGEAGDDRLFGGDGADVIYGGLGGDTLEGGTDNDMLYGGDGGDRLFGGTGADAMSGEGGNDRMVIDNAGDSGLGGAGIDTVQFVTAGLTYAMTGDVEIISNLSGGALTVTLNALGNTYGGSAGIDTVNAGDGQDSVYARAGNDVLRGQGGNDYLFGEGGVDTLEGGDGVDYLYGGTEEDMLFGGAGNDIIYGQDGADLITGGAGQDVLNGGTGSDRFIFTTAAEIGTNNSTADRITDFSQAQGDLLDLSGIDAIAGAGNDAFTFIGAGAFTNVAGQLRYQQISGATYVQGDIDGNGVADFIIRVDGLHALGAGDLIL